MLLRRASTAAVAAKRFSSLTRARDRRRAGAAGGWARHRHRLHTHLLLAPALSRQLPRATSLRRGNNGLGSAPAVPGLSPAPSGLAGRRRPRAPTRHRRARFSRPRVPPAAPLPPPPPPDPPPPRAPAPRPHQHLTGLLLPLLLLFPCRPKQHAHPHLLRCFAIAAHHAAVRDAGAQRAPSSCAPSASLLLIGISSSISSTPTRRFSSDPASFDILLQCLPSAPLLRRLRQYGISPSPEACNTVLSRLPADEAIELFQELPDKNICSYNILLKVLCSSGRLKYALQLFDEMTLSPDVVTYGILIHGYCALGDLENAVKLLDEMVARGVEPNATVYTSVIALLCEKKRVSDALKVVEDMVQRGVVFDEAVYTTVLSGFCSEGNLAAARRWFDEMQRKGLATDRVTYTTLINGLLPGWVEGGKKLLEWMLEKNICLNATTYNSLLKQYCINNNMKSATEIYKGMCSQEVMPNENTYNILIKGHCKARNMKEALHFHNEMIEKGFRLTATSFNSLIRLLNKKKKFVEARKLFDEMRKEGMTAEPDVYNFYIDLNFNEENLESTLALCDELVEASVATSKAEMDEHVANGHKHK
ncbi:hypothetical protein PR202_ga29837 [Eleusine coracana subsp. coracana]|uniref:Pentatricopeptide repeat-containing protein n=1 Tax=Eleusine coracana subsp. coracana TaxID=191504 RepID=A0AAV5DLV8_ELECO|nr:hypothetical protein PR202_ga29837 [Eleusine coracana subsp. coracana]